MGEYADLEIARQREVGDRMRQEHLRELATPDRRAAGQAEQARNLSTHEAREAALKAGLAHAATQTRELASAELVIVREARCLEARRGRSVLGRWWPDRRPQIGSRSIPATDFPAWLLKVVQAWRTPSRPR